MQSADDPAAPSASVAEAHAGEKRKEAEPSEEIAATPLPLFKKPSLPVKDEVPSFLRPPLLTVDTTLSEEAEEAVVPRTPANVRSMHRTEMHAAVCAGERAPAPARTSPHGLASTQPAVTALSPGASLAGRRR